MSRGELPSITHFSDLLRVNKTNRWYSGLLKIYIYIYIYFVLHFVDHIIKFN